LLWLVTIDTGVIDTEYPASGRILQNPVILMQFDTELLGDFYIARIPPFLVLDFSYRFVAQALEILETSWYPVSTAPYCEPQLGRRGLYKAMGGDNERIERQMAMLWILNQADGEHSLLDIANRAGIDYSRICEVAELLRDHELISGSRMLNKKVASNH